MLGELYHAIQLLSNMTATEIWLWGKVYRAIPLSWDKCTKWYYSVICQSWHFWSWHFGSWYFRSWHFGSWDYPLTLSHHTLRIPYHTLLPPHLYIKE